MAPRAPSASLDRVGTLAAGRNLASPALDRVVRGGIRCIESSPVIMNTIIAFEVMAIVCDGGSSPTLMFCDVYGNLSGDWIDCIEGQRSMNDNMSADPQSVDARHRRHVPRGRPSPSSRFGAS
jgi:hypothetical protein